MRLFSSSPLIFSLCVAAFTPCGIHAARPATDTSATPRSAVVVELFTSEGCSSCPPADALLRQMNDTETKSGQRILGISEHVTYWNGLGWSDPYSLAALTDRQNAYGARFGLDSVYTPQMVINGREQIVGSDAGALKRALAAESQQRQINLRILSNDIAGDAIAVHFAASNVPEKPALEIMAVLTDDADRSDVLRGENSGRALQHVAVARAMIHVATIHGDSQQTVHIPLPPALRAMQAAGHSVILFAQIAQSGPIVGADEKPF